MTKSRIGDGKMKRQIEYVADAIKFMVPLCNGSSTWTPHGMRVTKWPKDFSPDERKLIREIAKTALDAARDFDATNWLRQQ